MNDKLNKINASSLTGPRSYFTDIDPKDPDYEESNVKRKLKLQLLTKEKIVIAASSLFHNIGCNLFSRDEGLIKTLNKGIIIPAIRNEFSGPAEFFEQKKEGYPEKSKQFFTSQVKYSIPWDLQENSSWFKNTFYKHIRDPKSLLRQKISFSSQMAEEFIMSIEEEMNKTEAPYKFLQREHIDDVGKKYGDKIRMYLNNYANLLYRISGSKVVNSEGHFPQSNLTKLGVTTDDKIISDETIFWDIYVETIISFINSVLRLTPERLDQLSFDDILKIRRSFFDNDFAIEYDKIIKLAKSEVHIHDADKIILKQMELNDVARRLRVNFKKRIHSEINTKDTSGRENSLSQVGNVLAWVSFSPEAGLIVGALSSLKAIPEITALISKPLADSIERRYQWIRNYVNSKIGWSDSQKKTLIDSYKELVVYGLPK